MNEQKRITIFGDLFLDIMATNVENLPTWGTDTLARINMLPGGSAFNSCMHAAKFVEFKNYPLKIRLCGAIGAEDSSSQIFKERLNDVVSIVEDGVIQRSGHRTGKCIVLSSVNDRCFVTDRGIVDEMDLDWFGKDGILPAGTEHFHIGGYFNLSNHLRDQLSEFIKKHMTNEVTISITPQFDATGNWNYGLIELCPFIEYIIANENEILSIAKCDNVEEAAKIVLSWGLKFVVVTLGKHGSIIISSDIVFRQNPITVETVVDTTGAGDAFAAGFIVEYTFTKSIDKAALAGSIAAAAAISVIGGSTTPSVNTLGKYCVL
jgi:sugar/nucleoside kinase (ribokinase family)